MLINNNNTVYVLAIFTTRQFSDKKPYNIFEFLQSQ